MNDDLIPVLCTRELEEEYRLLAAGSGICIEAVPFITTEAFPPEIIRPLVQGLATGPAEVIFTSSKAVHAVAAALAAPPSWTVHCLSGATLQAVQDCWPGIRTGCTATHATALAEQLTEQYHRRQPLVFFCGDRRRPELPERFSTTGIALQETVVYATVPKPRQLQGPYRAVLFFSPSAAEAYLDSNTPAPGIPFFAIGPTTAAALSAAGHPLMVSPAPSTPQLIDTLIRYFTDRAYTT